MSVKAFFVDGGQHVAPDVALASETDWRKYQLSGVAYRLMACADPPATTSLLAVKKKSWVPNCVGMTSPVGQSARRLV